MEQDGWVDWVKLTQYGGHVITKLISMSIQWRSQKGRALLAGGENWEAKQGGQQVMP